MINERKAKVFFPAVFDGVEVDMPVGMLELGHRAWFALQRKETEQWIVSMLKDGAAPASGATSPEQKPKP